MDVFIETMYLRIYLRIMFQQSKINQFYKMNFPCQSSYKILTRKLYFLKTEYCNITLFTTKNLPSYDLSMVFWWFWSMFNLWGSGSGGFLEPDGQKCPGSGFISATLLKSHSMSESGVTDQLLKASYFYWTVFILIWEDICPFLNEIMINIGGPSQRDCSRIFKNFTIESAGS